MTLREENKNKALKKIVSTSRRLFREHGFAGTTIEDIAKGAELSRATVYNYFGKKEDILIAIADDEYATLEEMSVAKLEKGESAYSVIVSLMTLFIEDSLEYLELARRIAFYINEDDQVAISFQSKLFELIRELVIKAMGEDFREDINAADSADMILSLYYLIVFEHPKKNISKRQQKIRIKRLLVSICRPMLASHRI